MGRSGFRSGPVITTAPARWGWSRAGRRPELERHSGWRYRIETGWLVQRGFRGKLPDPRRDLSELSVRGSSTFPAASLSPNVGGTRVRVTSAPRPRRGFGSHCTAGSGYLLVCSPVGTTGLLAGPHRRHSCSGRGPRTISSAETPQRVERLTRTYPPVETVGRLCPVRHGRRDPGSSGVSPARTGSNEPTSSWSIRSAAAGQRAQLGVSVPSHSRGRSPDGSDAPGPRSHPSNPRLSRHTKHLEPGYLPLTERVRP